MGCHYIFSLIADVIAIVCLMADVNAIGGWWNATEFYVVDDITTWFSLADVIAKLCDVANVITTRYHNGNNISH